MDKEFKNIVVMNYGYIFNGTEDEYFMEEQKEMTRHKWFNYVVSEDAVESLKNILDEEHYDKKNMKKIIFDDIINRKNVIYSTLSEERAIKQASRVSENCLVLKLH